MFACCIYQFLAYQHNSASNVKTIYSPCPSLDVTEIVLQFFFFFAAHHPNRGLGRPIVEVSRSHTIRHKHQVCLLCTSDRLVSEAATYTVQQTDTRDEHPCPQRDSNLQSRQSSGFRPHGHRFRSCTKQNRQKKCALRGHYATGSGNFLPTFRDNLLVPKRAVLICFVVEACAYAKTGKIGHRGKDMQCLRKEVPAKKKQYEFQTCCFT